MKNRYLIQFFDESMKTRKTCFLHDFVNFKIKDKGLVLLGLDLFEKHVINDQNIFDK